MSSDNLSRLLTEFGVVPVIALELEWYVTEESGTPVSDADRQHYLEQLQPVLQQQLPLHSLNKEDGRGQVEAALHPHKDIETLVQYLANLKILAHDTAVSMGYAILFTAKPFINDYGNGLHLHLHLENEQGALLYWKDEAGLSLMLEHSIGGLLATMKHYLPVFAGSEAAIARYVSGKHAPVNVSWGMNNRTTAIRLPDQVGHLAGLDALVQSGQPGKFRRIEHRVASSEAEITAVINAVLEGIYTGLKQRLPAPAPIYGDASQPHYALEPLL